MPINDSAVLVPGVGHIWTGTVGTATKPSTAALATFASAGTIPAGWSSIGHTDLEDILAPGQDGGETEVKGSWQNAALRTVVTSQAIDYFVVKALQVLDRNVADLYWGSGGDHSVASEYGLPDAPAAVERATTIVFLDGSNVSAIYMAKASFLREDAMEFAADDFTKAPLRITALKQGSERRMRWISTAIGAAA